MTTTMPDKCPRCGVVWDAYRDVQGRVHTPGGMDCLRRQVAELREALRSLICNGSRRTVHISGVPHIQYEPGVVTVEHDKRMRALVQSEVPDDEADS